MKLFEVIKELQAMQAKHGGEIEVKIAGEDITLLEVEPAVEDFPMYVDFVGM